MVMSPTPCLLKPHYYYVICFFLYAGWFLQCAHLNLKLLIINKSISSKQISFLCTVQYGYRCKMPHPQMKSYITYFSYM